MAGRSLETRFRPGSQEASLPTCTTLTLQPPTHLSGEDGQGFELKAFLHCLLDSESYGACE